MDFKRGDIVRCKSTHGDQFIKGHLYCVDDFSYSNHGHPWIEVIKDSSGRPNGWAAIKFTLAKKVSKLEKLIFNINN